ncbi:MAG: 5-formyltetrahydrofolate cyclo-ligase [Candidatus Omnitrophica bacterium]|nr:5-formyltetrahydrofolate cyclo-ligase [Candidatus Omnitrophota bacterium]MDD5353681.1 5-formyltetrahydrofolate cyclo-ligase [bacterium]
MEKIKNSLRKKKLAARKTLSSAEVRIKSNKIKKLLFKLPEFKKAKTVMFYVSFGKEAATHSMIKEALQQKKKVVVPKIKSKRTLAVYEIDNFNEDLQRGNFGILEPAHSKRRNTPETEIDLVVVPGVCFDRKKGTRIGFGAGYYDRFLQGIKDTAVLIGIAFEQQLAKGVPCMVHDVNMHKIVTERRILEFS